MVDIANLVAQRMFGQQAAAEKQKQATAQLQAEQAMKYVESERNEKDREFSRQLELAKAQGNIDRQLGRRTYAPQDPRLAQMQNLGVSEADLEQKKLRENAQSTTAAQNLAFRRQQQLAIEDDQRALEQEQLIQNAEMDRLGLTLGSQEDRNAADNMSREAIARREAKAALERANAGAANRPAHEVKDAATIRREFQNLKTTKNAAAIAEANVKLQAAKPDAMGDRALIFAYMKLLDPDSVVRESEQEMIQNARSMGGNIEAWVGRHLSGKTLTDEQRAQIRNEAKAQMGAVHSIYAQEKARYEQIARDQGLDPALLRLQDFSASLPPPPKSPFK